MVEGETLDSESFIRSYDRTRLSKTELATLIALTFKNYNGNTLYPRNLFPKKLLTFTNYLKNFIIHFSDRSIRRAILKS